MSVSSVANRREFILAAFSQLLFCLQTSKTMNRCITSKPQVFFLLSLIVFSVYVLLRNIFPPLPVPSVPVPKDEYKLISPLTYKYILNQPDLCLSRNPFLVLLIPVTPQDTESRMVIRNTWGKENLVPNVDIARVFVLGEPTENNPKLREDLQKESMEHGDIVQMDFLDSYNNLTIKTMMSLNWLATYCPSAQYAMKIDTDNFLNLPYLVDYLKKLAYKEDYITGAVISFGRPRRDKDSKWYLSEEVYPHSWFPLYLSGAGYVFSVDLAKKILQASRFVRLIPWEDAYVGLCLHFLGVRPAYARTFIPYRNMFDLRSLAYDRCTFAKRILVNDIAPNQLTDMWKDFQSNGYSC